MNLATDIKRNMYLYPQKIFPNEFYVPQSCPSVLCSSQQTSGVVMKYEVNDASCTNDGQLFILSVNCRKSDSIIFTQLLPSNAV